MKSDGAVLASGALRVVQPTASALHARDPDSSAAFSGLRVLIVHDWITTWAGSERCVEQMLMLFPEADLVVGVQHPAMRDFNAVTRRARETWLARLPGARTHHRWFLPLEGLAFASLDTRGYDLIISSSHAFAKMTRPAGGAVHVCYCYSPPRYLWDLRDSYVHAARGVQRVAFAGAAGILRLIDRRSADRVHHFVAISHYIADRIRRCYGRDAEVVYPPVAAKSSRSAVGPRQDFLLSLGRLVSYKRVDLAIQAAERLGVRLVVAGDGPDRANLEMLAGPQTEFLGAVSESKAADLLESCAAFVFCADEDFGVAPVEANAHGAPVVGLARGGLLETMRDRETAEFFHEPTVPAICAAIRRALERSWRADVLRDNARRFAPAAFRRHFGSVVQRALLAAQARVC